ncbi:hypothetical protein B0H17DRAFT_448962 [Mycena rosella]|uniref:TPX2 C-terminal domain-containing protein n=1 Tax=Mycena rosella TaxID=1033263 RepID=A0AAD7FZF5_MYCRO|nr:hypothetical protein B0H17DRAFT_448962 [Mycena rosella]
MSISDLSLRHLPDPSDASFSFQIPTDNADELLCATSDDFFGREGDVPGFPLPNDAPLTLDELIPLPSVAPAFLPTPARTATTSLLPTTKFNIYEMSKVPKLASSSKSTTHIARGENTALSGFFVGPEQIPGKPTPDTPPISMASSFPMPPLSAPAERGMPTFGPPKSKKVATTGISKNGASASAPKPTATVENPESKPGRPPVQASKRRTVSETLDADPAADAGGAAARLMMFGHRMQMMTLPEDVDMECLAPRSSTPIARNSAETEKTKTPDAEGADIETAEEAKIGDAAKVIDADAMSSVPAEHQAPDVDVAKPVVNVSTASKRAVKPRSGTFTSHNAAPAHDRAPTTAGPDALAKTKFKKAVGNGSSARAKPSVSTVTGAPVMRAGATHAPNATDALAAQTVHDEPDVMAVDANAMSTIVDNPSDLQHDPCSDSAPCDADTEHRIEQVVDREETGMEMENQIGIEMETQRKNSPLTEEQPVARQELTLSQLSPRKPPRQSNEATPSLRDRAVSPMRNSAKRPASAASAAPTTNGTGTRSKKARVAPEPRVPPAAAGRARVASAARGRGGARVVSAPVQLRMQPARKARVASTHESAPPATSKKRDNVPSVSSVAASSSSSSVRVPLQFHFQAGAPTDNKSQSEADFREPHPKAYHIPDFAALHASQAAQNTLRRSQCAPTVPIPIAFSTDARVRERARFDAQVREREQKEEETRTVLRREREEREAEEVREMRKRAVPRAHEVPEWYKDAPKRERGE